MTDAACSHYWLKLRKNILTFGRRDACRCGRMLLSDGQTCAGQSNCRSVRVFSYIVTDGQSASMSWCRAPSGADDQILHFYEWQLLFFFLYAGRPLWREDGSIICNAITHWLESPVVAFMYSAIGVLSCVHVDILHFPTPTIAYVHMYT
jgi:hypothetical protein